MRIHSIAVIILFVASTAAAEIRLPKSAFPSITPVVTMSAPRMVCNNGVCRPVSTPACAQCGRVHSQATHQPRQQTVDTGGALTGQQAAQLKANYMARTGRTGHPRMDLNRRIAGGYGFEGTGWSSSGPNNVPTCTPRGRRQLIGDAIAQGRRGWHRVRIWR